MVTLRVLTSEDPPDAIAVQTIVRCDETYSCACEACERERSRLVRRGSKARRQPWQRAA